jgi:uncharacterized membrane protein required for colicin V production
VDLTVLDWIIFAVAAFFTVVGLFRGFSGQLGSLAGMASALLAGYFLFAPLKGIVTGGNWVSGETAQNAVAGIADFTAMLVVFGIVRRIVARFVSFLIPQPMNAIAGALIGLLKSAVVVGLLSGVGLIETGRFSDGFFAARSAFVKMAGNVADSYMQGAAR